jgi:hypothetical protein
LLRRLALAAKPISPNLQRPVLPRYLHPAPGNANFGDTNPPHPVRPRDIEQARPDTRQPCRRRGDTSVCRPGIASMPEGVKATMPIFRRRTLFSDPGKHAGSGTMTIRASCSENGVEHRLRTRRSRADNRLDQPRPSRLAAPSQVPDYRRPATRLQQYTQQCCPGRGGTAPRPVRRRHCSRPDQNQHRPARHRGCSPPFGHRAPAFPINKLVGIPDRHSCSNCFICRIVTILISVLQTSGPWGGRRNAPDIDHVVGHRRRDPRKWLQSDANRGRASANR